MPNNQSAAFSNFRLFIYLLKSLIESSQRFSDPDPVLWMYLRCSSTMSVDDSLEQLPFSCMLVMGIDNNTSQCLIFQVHWRVALCESLPACHALTGCDTTSSLFRMSKTTAFNKLEEHINELHCLRNFGLTDSLPETLACARKYAFTP